MIPVKTPSIKTVQERLKARQCLRCGYSHSGVYTLHKRYKCRECGWRYRPDRIERELQILRYFCLEISAHRVARELNMSHQPIWHRFMAFRRWMAQMSEEEFQPLSGELECDESYFGGRRRGLYRGRHLGHKVLVFGILERKGRVWTAIVPNATGKTLMDQIRQRSLKGAVFYTDQFKSYKSLRRFGKHLPVDHQDVYVKKGRKYTRHINGIEGFWSFSKERFQKYHGVHRRHFPFYLKEMEFRFNHRKDDLTELLGQKLIQMIFDYPIQYVT